MVSAFLCVAAQTGIVAKTKIRIRESDARLGTLYRLPAMAMLRGSLRVLALFLIYTRRRYDYRTCRKPGECPGQQG
jgi:hypothetical protein